MSDKSCKRGMLDRRQLVFLDLSQRMRDSFTVFDQNIVASYRNMVTIDCNLSRKCRELCLWVI